MAKRRVSMRKIREMLRLYERCGLSNRQIARALKISRPVVGQYLTNFRASELSYADITKMSDDELMRSLQEKSKEKSERYRILSAKFDYLARELKRPGVTLNLLWQEYKAQNLQGYSYSQFCYHFQVWCNSSSLSMHIDHKAGEKMFADYTGKKLTIYEGSPERPREVEIFVGILGASQLTYVEATESQKRGDWIRANENALWYFGGAPHIIVPDCLKSAVTKANKYEPDINPVYTDFASHYGTAIVPARPHSPRDKAMVENAVKITYSRVFAPLRDHLFHCLGQLNEAIGQRLEVHNNTPFQRMKMSRRQLFDEIEKDLLIPLPPQRYECKSFLTLKVQGNYHIELREDGHYYSVPYQYRGKQVNVIYTEQTVEIYYRHIRIALHRREHKRGYTTLKEHMSPQHRFYAESSPQEIIDRAGRIGDDVGVLVEKLLSSTRCIQQAFKSCMGIVKLSRQYGDERVNRACARALGFDCYSYKAVRNILEKGLDTVEKENLSFKSLPVHENIRGNEYFT